MQRFKNSTRLLAGTAMLTAALAWPTDTQAAGDENFQVYALQQSLRATNARLDQLEKELNRLRSEISNWGSSSKQHQVSYNGTPSGKPDRATPPSQGGGTIHHVASGDTLSSISRRYGIGLDRLVASNPGLDPHRIRIGQQIVVPLASSGAPAKVPAAAPTPAPAPKPAPAPAPSAQGKYIVRSGDTLSSIARGHQSTTAQLMAMNQLRNPNTLSVGQQLIVPGGSPPAGQSHSSSSNRYGSQPPSKEPAAAPQPESSSDLLTAPEGFGYYEVVRGDTLYSIALSFGTTSRELRSLNKLQVNDELAVGQYLLVPVADERLYES